MNYEVLEALGRITRERNLDRDVLLEDLQAGLLAAARRQFGEEAEIQVKVDEEGGEIKILIAKKVVDTVENPHLELLQVHAKEIQESVAVGDVLWVDLSLADFGRTAIQAAKQVVVQRVREAERERVHHEYQARLGEIVSGSIQQVDRGNIIVNLGRTEALLPVREQIRRETHHQGDTLRAYVLDVQKTTKGPQVILSRTHPGFLKKLFELEVPEISEGTVEIRAIAREAGGRSKVAVSSNDDRVDAVGACVGMKGSRVQSVVREVSGERIDIIQWSPDPIHFVTKALSPAKVSEVTLDEHERSMTVVVPEDQLSLAIGKGGQNARLAAKLTGWHIDLISEAEKAAREEMYVRLLLPTESLPGVGPKIAEALKELGIKNVRDVDRAAVAALLDVPGIGPAVVEKMKAAAARAMAEIQVEEERINTALSQKRALEQDVRVRADEAARSGLLGALAAHDEAEEAAKAQALAARAEVAARAEAAAAAEVAGAADPVAAPASRSSGAATTVEGPADASDEDPERGSPGTGE